MNSEPIRVFIGFDPREAVAFSVLAYSIHVRASLPVTIAPLMLSQLKKEMRRERHPLQSTDFSFSRFLVPSLAGFKGWALFMDCDMLAQAVQLRDRVAPLVALEASGGVNLQTVRAIAETGVERISVGAITHNAVWLDLGLDWQGC